KTRSTLEELPACFVADVFFEKRGRGERVKRLHGNSFVQRFIQVHHFISDRRVGRKRGFLQRGIAFGFSHSQQLVRFLRRFPVIGYELAQPPRGNLPLLRPQRPCEQSFSHVVQPR